jgi:hypothetical protein
MNSKFILRLFLIVLLSSLCYITIESKQNPSRLARSRSRSPRSRFSRTSPRSAGAGHTSSGNSLSSDSNTNSLSSSSSSSSGNKKIPNESRFQRYLRLAKMMNPPKSFHPDIISPSQHRNVSTVVLSVGIIHDLMPVYSIFFLGTLRKIGYNDDIVIAMHHNMTELMLETTLGYRPVLYLPRPNCDESNPNDIRCQLPDQEGPPLTIHMLRYYFYLWWSSKYESHTTILIADYRDVLFQSNPFSYLPELWSPPVADLTVFLESVPNKMIYRCYYNSKWIKSCYGEKALKSVSMNPVSCSGTSLGSRDGIMIYVRYIVPISSQIEFICFSHI